eukprot:SM000003S11097  [mRNA]  locus=s3:857343:865257:- [translate_table: standard]
MSAMEAKRRLDGDAGGWGTTTKRPATAVGAFTAAASQDESPPAAKNGGPPLPPDSLEEAFPEDDEDVYVDEAALLAEAAAEGRSVVGDRLARWRRPPPPALDAARDSIVFQQLEIDYVVSSGGGGSDDRRLARRARPAAVLRIFGVTEHGNSVCARVHGFEPYFYVRAPDGFDEDDCMEFQLALEKAMLESSKGKAAEHAHVTDVRLVQRRSVMYYTPERTAPFLRIVVATPTMVSACRGILERGLTVNGCVERFLTYESNVVYALRFMVDRDIVGGNWVELPAGDYVPVATPLSLCQIEVDIRYDRIVSHPPEGRFARLAPFRILSFDIECAGRRGYFPEAQKDSVIQIANMVTEQGSDKPFVRNVMTLRSCAPIVGAEVLSFDDEKKVLLAWREFVESVDPDIIIGYNICKFDLPYLIERAEALNVGSFAMLGRIRGSRLRMRDASFSSRQYGTRESKEVTLEGRVQLDVLQAVQRDYKLSSYSLNSVSAHFLGEQHLASLLIWSRRQRRSVGGDEGEQKEDVHHSIIADLQNGSSETRRRLAVYCLKDAYLPQRLLDKLKYVYNYVEMARVTGVPLSFLLARGQSIKVLSQLLRKAKQRGLLLPNVKSQQGAQQETYEGATVLEAKQGFFEKPIATLDFASLYPSIMMAHNLCYCTLVPKDQLAKLQLPPTSVTRTPAGDMFVKADVEKGILPEILEELLAARKVAKNDLKAATDPFEKAVLDGRQLALKISANSVYGFTGATVGQLPCLEISSSVTSYGREMIEQTKKVVESTYNIANGYTFEAEVVYGDTDSVMVQFGVPTVKEAMDLGREAAEKISTTFPKPIKLEFEKVYFPYLLISKKRYAGLLWTNPDTYSKMDTKGIETVRRDNCLLVKNVVTECLQMILVDRDIPGAVQYVKNGLTKSGEGYAVKSAHSELAERMRKRDAATAPTIGDRVPYVIIKGAKGAKAYEKSEDPIFVLENSIPIDPHYYLENQLSKPLLRIFDPILKNATRELLHGEHTRAVSISIPTTGGIMNFAKKRVSCLGCKTPMSDENATLCEHCLGREAEIYQRTVMTVADLEQVFGRLWTQCQRCQGSLHQDVLCTSRDCPIFYRRKKAQKDLVDAEKVLKRWDF